MCYLSVKEFTETKDSVGARVSQGTMRVVPAHGQLTGVNK